MDIIDIWCKPSGANSNICTKEKNEQDNDYADKPPRHFIGPYRKECYSADNRNNPKPRPDQVIFPDTICD